MRRVLAGLLALVASGCAPAPEVMPATQASELLERFAAGAGADVCMPEGRALLRGAVRSYGAEMVANGVAWPTLPNDGADPDRLSNVDISVLIAFAAGFVEASDFRGSARRLLGELSFAHWPELRSMRQATRVACTEAVDLQQAAARVVLETEHYRQMMARPRRGDDERLRRQVQRLERAHTRMQQMAAVVEARMREAG